MGFSIKRLFRSREEPAEITVEEVTAQQLEEAYSEVALRELAFWTCVGKIANALTKCEFRTYYKNKEVFGDEYYLWNYEPNRNQNKGEFLSKAMEKLFRTNQLLIVEVAGQLFVADSFSVKKNTIYGNSYEDVVIDDLQLSRTFGSDEVMHWTLNNKNVNSIINELYNSYAKLINYAGDSFTKSRGSRGVLNISAQAQADKLFNEKVDKLLNEHFKTFFRSNNGVLPLFDGYNYEDLGSKTYNETTSRDIKSQYDDIFDFTARGFSMPPSLAKGNVQDTSKAVDEMLTFCLDPLAEMLKEEINRKRNGKSNILKGTRLVISTSRAKHMDMFDISSTADKLIRSGVFSVNRILRAIDEPEVDEEWADRHMMTKNYSTIEEITEGKEVGE